jgi:outer membrane protein OmpA-like peptidoglycan-associated protein
MLTPPSAASPSASAQPAAVVLFPNDAVVLNAAAKAQIRNTAQAFQTHGGQGFVRVVGHSSSRTPDMPLERHLQVVFERSQERATAVARELIKDGVPAEKVLIEAVGDSQPMYYESMPQGEEGNRRAEIFLQS